VRSGEFVVELPVGGINRHGPFNEQNKYRSSDGQHHYATTPAAKNVFCLDVTTGRLRLGPRPVLLSLTTLTSSAAPYHWCPVSYLDSGTQEGVLVCTAQGTYSTLDFVTFTERIDTNPGSNFSTCAYFNGLVYQATSGANCRQAVIPAGASADLSNAGGGTAPTNCGLVWVHQGRLALSGKSDGAHQVFMSATGDATNWDYAQTTQGGAWANTGSEAGKIGQMVTAAINHNRDTSIVGSLRSMYGIVGNPRGGGYTTQISQSIGPLGNNAWCKGIDASGANSTFIMSYDGLYILPSGSLGEPRQVSRKKIPNDLIGVDPVAGDRCCIGYDSRWPAIHISVDYASGSDVNYVYHIPTDSWWEWTLPITPHLYPTFPKAQTTDTSAILPIGSAGSVRQYDYSAAQGGGNESFDSYIFIVVPLADPGSVAVLHSITAALAKDSEDCTCEIYVGDSYEQAYTAALAGSSPDFTLDDWQYTSTQYLNPWQHPRVRGHTAILRIEDSTDRRWIIEQIVARSLALAGRRP
jgi:hypothetical protein